MKRNLAFATIVAAAMTVGVAAQQTSAPQSEQDLVTIVGCVKPATPASTATGTTGTSATQEKEFILTDATVKSGASATAPEPTTPPETKPTEPTGTSGSMAGETYRLTNADDQNLQQYVNHKVEVRGEVQKSDSMSSPTAMPSSASAQKELKVTSVREISATCSGDQL